VKFDVVRKEEEEEEECGGAYDEDVNVRFLSGIFLFFCPSVPTVEESGFEDRVLLKEDELVWSLSLPFAVFLFVVLFGFEFFCLMICLRAAVVI